MRLLSPLSFRGVAGPQHKAIKAVVSFTILGDLSPVAVITVMQPSSLS